MKDVAFYFGTIFVAMTIIAMGALAVGFLPALVMIGYRKRYKMLALWIVLWLACVAAAVYGLTRGVADWKTYAGFRFKPAALYLGYFVGVLGACFVFPEPMRLARNRLRHQPRDKNVWQDDDGHQYKRKRRKKKRRTNQFDV